LAQVCGEWPLRQVGHDWYVLENNMAGPQIDLTLEQAKELQDSLIDAYSQPEFQQKLHKLFKDAAGDQMKELTARNEVCLPLQVPIVSKYGFTADQKGVSASLRSFRKPELQVEEINQQGQRLFYLVNPSVQDMDFLQKMGVTVSPLIKDAPKSVPKPEAKPEAKPAPKPQPKPTPKPASAAPGGNIDLTLEQAKELQDALENAYSTPEFQQKLHKLFKEAAGDPMKEMTARNDVCLPLQIPVVSKFGFSADAKGVSASLKAFRKPELQTEELNQQSQRMGYLVNPSIQDMEFLEKMGVTESPLLKDAPKPDQPPTPQEAAPPKVAEPEIALTVEQAIEFQNSLIQAYESPEFQSKLHSSFARLDGDLAEEMRMRADLCLPLQVPVVSKYGFTADKKGVSSSVRAFGNPDLMVNEKIQEQVERLNILVNPTKQDIAWVRSLGITESPLFRDPVSIFSIVVIVGLTKPVEPSPAVLDMDPDMQPVEVNGHKGWTVAWVEEEQGFIVQTFGGHYVCLPEENLRVYLPPYPESGGFDAAWPPDEPSLVMNFSAKITDSLKSKSFCVIQMTHPEAQKSGVLTQVDGYEHWTAVAPEFQDKFMGLNPVGKIRWLRGDESEDPECWIGDADLSLDILAETLGPQCPQFGFRTGGRSKTMLRRVDPLEQAGDTDVVLPMDRVMNGDEVGNMLKFVNRSKIGMIYFLYGNGGFLAIDYNDGKTPSVNIPIQAGRLVLVSQEHVAFSYYPSSECVSLQSWMLREELPGEVSVRPDHGLADWDASQFPVPPAYGESGETVDCMSMAPITGGVSSSRPEDFWAMLQTGGDTVIPCPIQRWDSNVYHDPAGGDKMYSNHFGFITDFEYFDNEIFGLSKEYCNTFDPAYRKSMESGLSALERAGWDRKSLQNAEIAVSYGSGGGDWHILYALGLTTQEADPQGLMDVRTDFCNNRLSWVLNLRGPVINMDTACSASLAATAIMHSKMRPQEPNSMWATSARQIKYGLVQGISGIFEPTFPTALCHAGMLTHQGRCFTFDQSADGFARGDGASAMYWEAHSKECLTRYAALMGTCINQDGRSASLTAPNGPSQQECIRHSLREADITPLSIHMQELHGTGTALGDPIEVGALRATMMKIEGKVRKHPLVKTSSKSNLAHSEGNAGISGIMKCVLMGCHAVACPGVHLRMYNSHIEYAGYPVLFNPDCIDQNNWGYVGVSSFGFSGCNARGDVYTSATMGHRRTLPFGNDYTYARHLMLMPKIERPSGNKALLDRKEDELEVSSEWAGFFQSGNPINPGTTFQLSGSWSSFMDMEAMVLKDGAYQWCFIMGDTLSEEFRIHTDYFFDSIICPATKKAGKDAIILGPGTAPKSYTWRIDGRSDGAEPGDLYFVKFSWDEQEKKKKIDWEIVRGEAREEMESSMDIPRYEHRYSVKGTWSAWTCVELSPILGLGYIHETTFRIGINGYEDFYIVRDLSDDQSIYPATKAIKDTKVAVRGPDANRKERCWRVQGACGEQITLRLRVRKGEISVSVVSPASKERTWHRASPGMDDGMYFVDGSWLSSGQGLTALQPHRSKPNIFSTQVKMSQKSSHTFRILVDEEPEQAFYPEMKGAESGQAAALGPDHLGPGLCWNVIGEPSATVQITLDLTNPDKRERVTWDFI